MKIAIFCLTLLISNCVIAVSLGYVTGDDYFRMSENEKSAWLAGVSDGIIAESLTSSSLEIPWLSSCIAIYEFQQIKAIFEKELNDNPEVWHAPAAFIFRKKIKDFCGN
ncbi:hypothetical protein ACFOSD_11725 [Salinispirillum marinum]|uniref:Rap1a immunity protein domain-containing protein n=2 Tax=Saccharospirillaceae TaxID=255527 RepID=A0ABV8BGF5_9GAMM